MSKQDPYELAYHVDRLMRRMNAGIEARASQFDPERVGPIGGMVLLTIAETQPAALQTIADLMARDKGQLSRVVSALERRALLYRLPNEADARSRLIALTEKGEDFVVAIKRALDDTLGEILAGLDDVERAELLVLLKKL